MNGPHDVGGMHGFGRIEPAPDEPHFHAAWERRAFALTLAMGATGLWTLDRSRHERESLPRLTYYGSSYYGIWFAALERLCVQAGVIDGTPSAPSLLAAEAVRPAMARGAPSERSGPPPRFAVGDRVRVNPMRPSGHVRAPSYVRGRVGTISATRGCHVFPDSNAQGKGEQPTPLYNVAFAATELWGRDTTAHEVRLDLFEPYLVSA